MERPLLTPGDRYLVVLSADCYDQAAAHYREPHLTALTLRSSAETSTTGCTTFHARDLACRGVPGIQRILEVRPCPTNSYNVAVVYTNESDRVGGRDGGRDHEAGTGCGRGYGRGDGRDHEADIGCGHGGGRGCGRGHGAGTGWRTVGGRHAPVGYEAEGRSHEHTTATNGGEGGYRHNFGFLILDVCSGVVCQVNKATVNIRLRPPVGCCTLPLDESLRLDVLYLYRLHLADYWEYVVIHKTGTS